MGEWSDYFEDFPEENPANYVGGNFDPHGAQEHRQLVKDQNRRLGSQQAALDAEIARIIAKHRPK